jgi:hypothetical protein
MNSPLEFQVLPGAGWARGGDILYVDDIDDRGGPVQLYFDNSFRLLGLIDYVDRFDVLGPSSEVGNSPGGVFGTTLGRKGHGVKDVGVQIIPCYQKIIWSSGNLSAAVIDGISAKENDFRVLYDFVKFDDFKPGLYLCGDDLAQTWNTSINQAINLRAEYCDFTLTNGNHVAAGEPITPKIHAVNAAFIHLGVPDSMYVFGGCPIINDFDVLNPVGASVSGFDYPNGSGSAVIMAENPNEGGTDARVVLSGFDYGYIRDDNPGFPTDQTDHLRDILLWLINEVNPPVGSDPKPQFANALRDNFPNPFNPTTTIEYSIKEAGLVSLKVYNVAGQLVRTLVNEQGTPQVATFTVTWDGRNDAGEAVSSGVYFYKLVAQNFTQTKKMVLLK